MKTMNLGNYFLSLAIMAFLLFSTGNAFAANAMRDCDHVSTAGNTPHDCQDANNFMVLAPYWQVDSGSYTFIAVTHTSLSGMASQIGVHVNAITSAGHAYDTAETFTVTSGNTERVFIVPTNHATVNVTSIPNGKFLSGTSDYTYGAVKIAPVMTNPALFKNHGYNSDDGAGFRDITMLSYWGSVIIEANTTGFAMEFLGDMNDSIALPQMYHASEGVGPPYPTNLLGGARGTPIYDSMSTGPNLQ
jgi:hypothetical protein